MGLRDSRSYVAEKDPYQAAVSDAPSRAKKSMLNEVRARLSEHDIVWKDARRKRGFCRRCRSTFEATQFASFARSPCGGELLRGGKVVHPSHRIQYRQDLDLHFCEACGATSRMSHRGSRLMKLAGECRPRTRAGEQNLRRIQRNLLPGTSAAAVVYNRGRLRRRAK